MKGIIYSRNLPAIVWKGLNTVAIFLQLYEKDYIQLGLSFLYMYTLECIIWGHWTYLSPDFRVFNEKRKKCYPSKLTFTLWLFSVFIIMNSQTVNQYISQSGYQSINQSINQSISQSVNQSNSQSANQLISQSINQSISQSVLRSIIQSVNSVNQSISQ